MEPTGRMKLPLTDQQAQMIRDLDQQAKQAGDRLNLVLSAVLAGHGIAEAQIEGLEDGALVVKLPEAPKVTGGVVPNRRARRAQGSDGSATP